jgi:hypothetical protein
MVCHHNCRRRISVRPANIRSDFHRRIFGNKTECKQDIIMFSLHKNNDNWVLFVPLHKTNIYGAPEEPWKNTVLLASHWGIFSVMVYTEPGYTQYHRQYRYHSTLLSQLTSLYCHCKCHFHVLIDPHRDSNLWAKHCQHDDITWSLPSYNMMTITS